MVLLLLALTQLFLGQARADFYEDSRGTLWFISDGEVGKVAKKNEWSKIYGTYMFADQEGNLYSAFKFRKDHLADKGTWKYVAGDFFEINGNLHHGAFAKEKDKKGKSVPRVIAKEGEWKVPDGSLFYYESKKDGSLRAATFNPENDWDLAAKKGEWKEVQGAYFVSEEGYLCGANRSATSWICLLNAGKWKQVYGYHVELNDGSLVLPIDGNFKFRLAGPGRWKPFGTEIFVRLPENEIVGITPNLQNYFRVPY